MSPELLARSLQEFLSEARSGVALEDDQIIFDLAVAQYSVSADRGRCMLHLWSEERNIVRQVIDAEAKNGSLILSVQRFGQNRPHKLELCRDRDRRSQSARTAARKSYARLLEHTLRRQFPDWKLDRLSTTMDLERSFSPVYARGLLRKGRSAAAVLGVNQQETQSSIDAALTFGLLWLDHCREREAGQSVVEGVKLFAPPGSSTTLRIRMAQLNHSAAKFQLHELDELDESLAEIDCADTGNINTRLVRCPDHEKTRSRFHSAIARVLAEVPNAEVAVLSPTEISFRLHGMEFAKARLLNAPGSFDMTEEFVFGVGGYQAPLTGENHDMFRQFAATIRDARTLDGNRHDPLWRMYPERWLESLVFSNVAAIDGRLDPAHVYAQVPAFSASDRAMIDVLARTRDGRLAVLELKADEDIHLPMQGLDYWSRVKWHHHRDEFQAHGYFAGVELSPKPPLLMMVAPALRVHPSIDTVLRYFSPEIEWTLMGVDERWREGVKVVFRKHSIRKPMS
ncbi:MAG TPA: hypothetical protein VE783_11680 [Candidatus Limnocylindrales bacterium]|nr:hypothetical protein [Candidatus Limnocylindrales bacterium]